MKWKFSLLLLSICCCMLEGKAQKVAVKTNLLWDGLATVSLGAECGLAPRWTMEVSGNYNGWNMSHFRRRKHWFIQPEARYWLCERFAGHFFGMHLHGGKYNLGKLKNDVSFLGTDFSELSDKRYQGWFAGGGVAYGHAWILGKHWNFEGEIGIGYAYSRYDCYPCATCGTKIEENEPHHYVGPTKLALNLVYLF